jgi:hypothetical protein|tara:strand:+ start:769 stop:999 length:231 start_codon:yes stop_codon:yes gene_type:complete
MTRKQAGILAAAIEVIEDQSMKVMLAQIETRDDFGALSQLATDMAEAQDVLLSMIDGRVETTIGRVKYNEAHTPIN